MSDNLTKLSYNASILFRLDSPMWQLPLHPAISHLTQQEVEELIAGYKSGGKVGDLMLKFGIDSSPNQLRGMLPPEKIDQYCQVCDTQMVQDIPARKGNQRVVRKISCPICGHTNNPFCLCPHCVQEQNRLAENERARIQKIIKDAVLADQLNSPHNDCVVENLSLAESVAFLALTRCCPIDDQFLCGPLAASTVPFAPVNFRR